ncbi:hypothetical protein F5B17DRAFT_393706 [Nemania serpens]|nr:hypothetical protein F5B17DRAFT_393706 [Nemania serpens]
MGLSHFKDERVLLIQYLFARYSELHLTKATDRPVAITGLQGRLGRTFKSGIYYGIMWKYFERTMLWKRTGRALSRIKYEGGSAKKPPSWSWMAFSGTIGYLEIPFGNVSWTGDLEKSEVHGELTVRAIARRITLDESYLSCCVTLDTDIMSEFGDGCWRCVTVGRDKTPNDFGDLPHYVLVIQPVADPERDATYERIGVGVFYASDFSDEVERVSII